MSRICFALLPTLLFTGCFLKNPGNSTAPGDSSVSLSDARKGHTTKLAKQHKANEPVPNPPAKEFKLVKYDSPAGKLAAYVTPNPQDGLKSPAIIWITGGDCNTIGDSAWTRAKPSNDQSARQYRDADIVMMFPSLRGGNNNPGSQESFYGEVDDVIAAADYLAKLDYVDPKRIYLGGHSTGGTLALLVAESTDKFRAVFSFGPVESIKNYDREYVPAVNFSDQKEVDLRSPGLWLHSIQCPTFVFEGTVDGNLRALEVMATNSKNAKAHFYPVKGANHFSVLAPVNQLIAKKIVNDEGPETKIAFTEDEVNKAVGK